MRQLLGLMSLGMLGASGILPAVGPEAEKAASSEIDAVLAEPVTVRSRVGRNFSGQPLEVDAERIVLRAEADGGTVDYTFLRKDVVHVRLPGARLKGQALEWITTDEAEAGLDLLDRLFRQRSPFFSYLPPSEAVFFAETVPFYRAHRRTRDGLVRAEALVEFVAGDAGASRLLRDEILLGYFLSGDHACARALAEKWIEDQSREAASALGWHVLGALQEAAEAPSEETFFTYLRPIVFSGPREMPYLADCYAGAIDVAVALERWRSARQLWKEMRDRGLFWPETRAPLDSTVRQALEPAAHHNADP